MTASSIRANKKVSFQDAFGSTRESYHHMKLYDDALEYLQYENFEKALAAVDQAIDQDPLNPKLFVLRFKILKSKHASHKNTADFLAADKDIVRLLDPNDTDIQIQFIDQCLQDQRTTRDKIQAEFVRLKINPVRSFVHKRRRELHCLLGEHQEQLTAIHASIKSNHETNEDILELGQTYYQLGQYDKALEYLQNCLNPPLSPAACPIAQCYYKKGDYEAAQAHLLKKIGHITRQYGETNQAKIWVSECERYLRVVQKKLNVDKPQSAIEAKTQSFQVGVPSSNPSFVKYVSKRLFYAVTTPRLPEELVLSAKLISFAETLGKGGFSTVIKGEYRDPSGPTLTVAVKQYHDVLSSKKKIEEFEAEANLLSSLRSDYIIKLHGVLLDVEYSLVLEFMHYSLHKFLEVYPRERLPWEYRHEFAYCVASALVYLHTRSPCIIHRDIKSANILIDANYQAKLSDFGTAISLNHNDTWPQTVDVPGTTRWMAPELFEKDARSSLKCDIYSFGMVMLEIARHEIPFKGVTNKAAIITQIKRGQLDQYPADTPAPYKQLGEFCTAINNPDRPTATQALRFLGYFKKHGIFMKTGARNPFDPLDPVSTLEHPGEYFYLSM